jgi:hypothetical protein
MSVRSQNRQSNKRSRSNKAHHEDPLFGRDDDPHPESYSRSHHNSQRSDGFRSQSSSSRVFEPNRDASSSRSHREPDSWRENYQDRYDRPSSNDGYRWLDRDEYDMREHRQSDWSRSDSHIKHSRDEWPQRYERDYPTSHYSEASSWNFPPSTSQYHHSSAYPPWQDEDRRPLDFERYPPRELPREHSHWQQDHGRDRRDHIRQHDSGWNNNRRKGRDGQGKWKQQAPPESGTEEDRSWEPAASWQATNRENTQSAATEAHENGHHRGHNNGNKHSSSQKKGQHQNHKQKRDWRNDDGSALNLNK